MLDDDDPPFYSWFTGGTLNALRDPAVTEQLEGRVKEMQAQED